MASSWVVESSPEPLPLVWMEPLFVELNREDEDRPIVPRLKKSNNLKFQARLVYRVSPNWNFNKLKVTNTAT